MSTTTPGTTTEYLDALAWLYAQTRDGGRRHPGRAAALLTLLDLRPPPNIVRVVGTNGKGSVCHLVAAGLHAHGHVAGRFLSPHVESFLERVSVGGRPIAEEQLTDFVAQARAALAARDLPADLKPSFFELTLAMAFTIFEGAGVTHAVLEAGVGGASDATSAAVAPASAVDGGRSGADSFGAPVGEDAGVPGGEPAGVPGGEPAGVTGGPVDTNLRLVVLTNVDLDHTETLGRTVGAIAAEKAGAFVRGVPAVTGATGEALKTVQRLAVEVGVPLRADDGNDPLFSLPPGAPAALTAPGAFGTRLANARLATAAMRSLAVSERSIVAALASPSLPARGERFWVDGREVVLDGAHDPAAAARLATDVGRAYVLLFGSLARKQGAATLAALEPSATAVIVTAVEPGDDLTRLGGAGRDLVDDPAAALRLALELTEPGGLLLIAGSLYLAGTLRPLLHSPLA